MVHVDLTPCAHRETVAWEWLDRTERARWKRFRFPAPRRRFALCRAALRALLCGALGAVNEQLGFAITEHGKPRAQLNGRRAAISFNVSHSGRHGLVAFAPRGRLGVDIEERSERCDIDGLRETVCGPLERVELAAARGRDRLDFFLTLWTLKEALVKATGHGLSCDMSQFEIPSEMRHGQKAGLFRFPREPDAVWRLKALRGAAYVGAVAYEQLPNSGRGLVRMPMPRPYSTAGPRTCP